MNRVGIAAFLVLLFSGVVLSGMGNLDGVCIYCAYEHGYGWQIEQANNFMYAGIIVTILAFVVLALILKSAFNTQQQIEVEKK